VSVEESQAHPACSAENQDRISTMQYLPMLIKSLSCGFVSVQILVPFPSSYFYAYRSTGFIDYISYSDLFYIIQSYLSCLCGGTSIMHQLSLFTNKEGIQGVYHQMIHRLLYKSLG
jgi:hypothetical protein